MDVLDVGTEILNRGLRGLVRESVGVMYIPQSRDLAAVHLVEKRSQSLRVGVNSVRLYKERDAGVFSFGGDLLYRTRHILVVDLAPRVRLKVGENTDIRSAELHGEPYVLRKLSLRLLELIRELKAAAGGETGYF